MVSTSSIETDYIFEVSWEICNKIGGIHTVIASKAGDLQARYGDRFVLIGPDIWKEGDNGFEEDASIFSLWRDHAHAEGLKLRVGRWNIPSRPIVILIDFTSFFSIKNDILTEFWDNYQIDSINGQWDFIEPALFGYAAGRAIVSYYRYHFNANDRIIAQFHEWTSGAGILSVQKEAPQIATVFTAHATVLGRVLAATDEHYYRDFEHYDPETCAVAQHVVAKHSLEKTCASRADCFTTLSDMVSKECAKFLGRLPDVITPNGVSRTMVPDHKTFDQKRKNARKRIADVVEALTNQKVREDAIFVLNSGRMEYRNKGLDVFIDSLVAVTETHRLRKPVIALVLVPLAQATPLPDVKKALGKPDFDKPNEGKYLTHEYPDIADDVVLQRINSCGLQNDIVERVKLVYVPVHMNGRDGIFNLDYYDLLIGFDLTVFPSYYEPWGYAPLESLAFHIPTITTSLSGFGATARRMMDVSSSGIHILNRTDDNRQELVQQIAELILKTAEETEIQHQIARADAYKLSEHFLWKNLLQFYDHAYDIALNKSAARKELFKNKYPQRPVAILDDNTRSKPYWRSISIQALLPAKLAALHTLSHNLWWSWNGEVIDMFRSINPVLWDEQGHNPIRFLQKLNFEKVRMLEADEPFQRKLSSCFAEYNTYISEPRQEGALIAYFSMEYGLANFIKLYSGGLGILAGDYLKEASDQNKNLVAIGLFFKNGYFRQSFTAVGMQLDAADVQEPEQLPLQLVKKEDGSPVMISLFFPARTVYAQIWKLPVGRVSLYLLDTNVDSNTEEDRKICSQLYDGDSDMRLKQELLLGIGGIRALTAMDIHPDVFHCNEGHAAFINIQRIQNYIVQEKLRFEEALELVRSSTLFTTHTAVAAANDRFTEDQLRTYFSENVQVFNIEWNTFMGLGRANPKDSTELFSMTYLAAKLSQEVNSVSKIHQAVTCRLLNPLWEDFQPGELHIRNVTNGVHFETWTNKRWQDIYRNAWGKGFSRFDRSGFQGKMAVVPDNEIWSARLRLKKDLTDYIKKKITTEAKARSNPKKMLQIANNLNENALFIGFARRFATYKRADLLFSDLDRLTQLLGNADMPVHILISGKAHPEDDEGKELIKKLLQTIEEGRFLGKILFLEDYDMDSARLLVQGVDLWLNTPIKGKEASGTSGMKAAMNGVLTCSVLDGWWAEAYTSAVGWAIDSQSYLDENLQNQLDAESLYAMLESEIVPLFFERDYDGLPVKWIELIRNCVSAMVPEFSMSRVLKEYDALCYSALYVRSQQLKDNSYATTRRLSAWKSKLVSCWDEIAVIAIDQVAGNDEVKTIGERFNIEITLHLGAIDTVDIGLEIVVLRKEQKPEEQFDFSFRKEFTLLTAANGVAKYSCSIPLGQSGAYSYSFRVFPKNELLAHRLDFPLVKWI